MPPPRTFLKTAPADLDLLHAGGTLVPSVSAWQLDNTPAVLELARSRLDDRGARHLDELISESPVSFLVLDICL